MLVRASSGSGGGGSAVVGYIVAPGQNGTYYYCYDNTMQFIAKQQYQTGGSNWVDNENISIIQQVVSNKWRAVATVKKACIAYDSNNSATSLSANDTYVCEPDSHAPCCFIFS